MDVTATRTVLVYPAQPEDTSTGGQSRHGIRDLPEKTLRKFYILKACLWICLAVIVALFISSFR
jgi:hypothetical protein